MNRRTFHNSRGIIGLAQALVGLGLLVVLAVALNAVFASRGSQPAGEPQQPTLQPPVSSTPETDTGQATSVVAWKEYSNSKDGYAIKYPDGWHLNEISSIITSYDPNEAPGRSGIPSTEIKVWIIVNDNENRLSTEEWVEEHLSSQKNQSEEMDTTVIEQREVQVGETFGILQKGYRTIDPQQTVTRVYLARNNRVYTIFAYPADSRYSNIFLEMLRSFRFLEM